jgi:hypothetical protein
MKEFVMFELLEGRTLLSASLAGGVLTLNETNYVDTVVIGKSAKGDLFVSENGTMSLYTWSAVTKVVANLMAGNDLMATQGNVNKPIEIHCGDGNDMVTGGAANDSIYGDNGNDYIDGREGNDYLNGGADSDSVHGFLGDDSIYGGTGNDYLYGEGGNDQINGDNGTSLLGNLNVFTGVDKFVALEPLHNDLIPPPVVGPKLVDLRTDVIGPRLLGGLTPMISKTLFAPVVRTQVSSINLAIKPVISPGILTLVTYDDYLSGGDGNDTVRGNGGNDTCNGNAGNDRVYGDDGNDFLYGDDGTDSVYGGAGNDFSCGGNGDDVLVSIGGGTADSVRGDAGRDEFWIDDASTESILDADFWGESLGGTVHRVGVFANGASKELNGQNLTDPDMSNNRTATTYIPDKNNFSNHPLFADSGPNQDDIVQGQVGDCYFLAGLSSTARVDPQRIKNSVVDLGDGTYAAQFFDGSSWKFYRVDGDLATYKGTTSLYYANLGTSQSIWAPIMEKAFADFRSGANSYNSLHGGGVNEPFVDLGGSPTGVWDSSSQTNTLMNIYNALAAGKAVDALTPNSAATNGCPCVQWHVYSVESVQMTSLYIPFYGWLQIPTSVTLRNPWGVDGGGSTDANTSDGYVTVTASQFFGYFTGASASYM